MRIEIEDAVLEKYGITLDEFLALLLAYYGTDIKEVNNSLIAKNLADRNLFMSEGIIIGSKAEELMSSILVDSSSKNQYDDAYYEALASKMQELYPAGKKPGTTYMWRGTVAEIAKKLKTLVSKYGYTLEEDKVLAATKNYVNSFNGDYQRMRLLKYFILKSEKDEDGNVVVVTDLMAYIENEADMDSLREDWTSSLN
jgi:hypothetical protein